MIDGWDTAPYETGLLSTLLRNPQHAAEITEAVEPSEIADPNVSELWTAARKLLAECTTPDPRAMYRTITGHERHPVMAETLKRAMVTEPDGLDVEERVSRIREARRRERVYLAGLR